MPCCSEMERGDGKVLRIILLVLGVVVCYRQCLLHADREASQLNYFCCAVMKGGGGGGVGGRGVMKKEV